MKNIILTMIVIVSILLCTSCATFGEFIDYGISEWEKITPANSYDRTYIDAWQSGTGGKVMAVSGVTASLFSNSNNEASQTAKKIINDAINDFNSHDEFKSNDVSNWFGAMLTMGDVMLSQYRLNKIEKELEESKKAEESKKRKGSKKTKDLETTRGNCTNYIDNVKRMIDEDLARSFSARSIDMTLEKYYSLPKDERQKIDILLLQDPIKNDIQLNTLQQPENKVEKIEPSYWNKIDSLSIGGYKFNNITLTNIQKKELDNIINYLTIDNTLSIEIVGHTCSIGSQKGNYNVGLQRAINAKNYLVDKGIDANRIKVVSESYNCPKASNNTPEGRALNRRITFNVIRK